MKKIAIYPGRFQPFGLHHKKVFESLQSEFGEGNVYIVTSNKTDSDKSPFTFTEKESIMVATGIPQNQIKEVRSPYAPQELFDELGDEQIAAIFVYGAKDAGRLQYTKKDGSQGYYKPYDEGETNLEKYDVRGYVKISPTFDIPIQTGDQIESMSGTTIRKAIRNGVDPRKVYGNLEDDILELISNKIGSIKETYPLDVPLYDFAKTNDTEPKTKVPHNYKYRDGGLGFSARYRKRSFGESIDKGKTLHAYDFDDTIASVETPIPVELPDGTVVTVPSDIFPDMAASYDEEYGKGNWIPNFEEFEKQISSAIVNSNVVEKLKKSLSDPSIDKVTILTARTIGHPVTKYLKSIGLDAYVVPLGLQKQGARVTGQDKANWIEQHINKGYNTIYFIDDSDENRIAVEALKDKYPNINLTVEHPDEVNEMMMGTMNNQEKAKHAKNLKRLKKDLRNQGDQYKEVPSYLKGTLTRKLYEDISPSELDTIETYADELFAMYNVDVNFTNHFKDRVNDARNNPEITKQELINLLYKAYKEYGEAISNQGPGFEAVLNDLNTKLNLPFVLQYDSENEELDLIAKTIMRKQDFQTSSPKLPLEEKRLFSKEWWSDIVVEFFAAGVAPSASDAFTIIEAETNVHMTHLEELILKKGQEGYDKARDFLVELLKTLGGKSDTKINTSVKWDGAPAIVAGYDPEDGEFFVGTKNAFSNNPFLNKTDKDIDTNFAGKGSLIDKLKLALKYLKPIWGDSPIMQGDYMFGETKDSRDFDGVDHIIFKPNTIVYAVEKDSDLGKTIETAKMGIVFHTTYDAVGKGAPATFGADVSTLNQSEDVWFDDAWFDDDTGNVLITPEEAESIKNYIKEADSIKVDYSTLPLDALNIYINSEIRGGQFLENPEKSFNNFINWYRQKVEKSTEKVKRPETKERKRKVGEENINKFNEQKENMFNVFRVSKLLSQAKIIFINKYNNAVYKTKHFKEAEDGSGDLVATNPEGYVAVDHIGSAVKLVDRLEFSKANFQTGKPNK